MTKEAKGDNLIQDALEDKDGNKFLCFGEGERRCCIPLVDLHALDKNLLGRLERAGVSLVTTAAKEALKREAQSVAQFRKIAVASAPGWIGDVYASPDGSTIKSRADGGEMIVAFEPDYRFGARSDLVAWQEAVAPFVRDQPLVLFALAFSFVGPLLHFAPPDMQNPIIELVGQKEKGKSTLAKLMSSVWGGDPNASLGICLHWDFSPAEIDSMRASRRDGLLVLDEVNRASKDEREKAKIVESAIFKLADSSSRRRHGEAEKNAIRQATVSTSNMLIRELSAMPPDTKEAMLSRILSIKCDRPFGIFDTLPLGFTNADVAVRAMNAASTDHAGCAASAFIERLLVHPPKTFKAAIVRGMNLAASLGLTDDIEGARLKKTVAMAYTAGRLARQLGVLPKSWGRIDHAFTAIFACGSEAEAVPAVSPARRAIAAYIESHHNEIRLATDDDLPLAQKDFEQVAGVWVKHDELLVASPRFIENHLANAPKILKQLRDEGMLDCEAGQLTKKAPRAIATGGRAHFFKIWDEPISDGLARKGKCEPTNAVSHRLNMTGD